MSHPFAAVVVYDDPDCAGAADAFAQLSKQLPSAPPSSITSDVLLVPAGGSKPHGDALIEALRSVVNVRPSELVVVGLLKDASAGAASQKIREICTETKLTECHIATHLAGFGDVGLVVRNLVRRYHEHIAKLTGTATQ